MPAVMAGALEIVDREAANAKLAASVEKWVGRPHIEIPQESLDRAVDVLESTSYPPAARRAFRAPGAAGVTIGLTKGPKGPYVERFYTPAIAARLLA